MDNTKALEYAYEYYEEDDIDYEPIPSNLKQVLGCYSDEGYGHIDIVVVATDNNFKYYAIEAGGCSCGGSSSTSGPHDTLEQALNNISEMAREDLEKQITK